MERPEPELQDAPPQVAAMEADFLASLYDARKWQAILEHACRQASTLLAQISLSSAQITIPELLQLLHRVHLA